MKGPLSYEHIPPKSLGNSKPAKAYSVVDLAEQTHSLNQANATGLRYVQQQRGIGFQTICRTCNTYLGQHYVKAFTGCIEELGTLLREPDDGQGYSGIYLKGHGVPLLAFFKHVISNFCSTTQPGSMLDCREFLLDCKSNAFPERYRLFMFGIPEAESFVFSGWTRLLLNENGLKIASLAFIATPPVGFYLYDMESSTAAPEASRYGCEITSMASQP